MNPDDAQAQVALNTQPHSIEVTRNARGEYQWVLKRYFGDRIEDQTFALEMIADADVWLRNRFVRNRETV